MRQLYSFIILIFISLGVFAQCPSPDFNVNTANACSGSPITITNTTLGNNLIYNWDFCAGDLVSGSPTISNIATLPTIQNNKFTIIQDNGNWYGFVCSFVNGNIIRLDFGNSLDNLPTLDTVNVSIGHIDGIDMINIGGHWYGFVGGIDDSDIHRLDFGSITNNNPTDTVIAINIHIPISVALVKDSGNYFALITNFDNSTVTELSFGNNIANNTPVVSTISSGLFSTTWGLAATKFCNVFIALVTNQDGNSVTRLAFSSGLNAAPVISNVGISTTSNPKGIDFVKDGCNIYAFYNTFLGNSYKLDFGSDINSVPTNSVIGGSSFNSDPRDLKVISDSSIIRMFGCNWGSNNFVKYDFTNNCSANISIYIGAAPPPVTYSSPGTYIISLTATDTLTGYSNSFCQTIIVNLAAPSTGFIIPPVCSTLPVVFQDTTTDSTVVTAWWWNFGDGGTSSTKNTTHVYLADGTYIVTHVVALNGCTDTVFHTVVFKDEPIASFTVSHTCNGDSTVFLNQSTCYDNMTFLWDFGDFTTSTFQNPMHLYGSTGTYNVTLTVTSDSGCINSITIPVTISAPSNSVISFTPTTICGNAPVNFTDTYSNAPSSYLWSFGDLTTSVLSSPSHSYSSPGTYNIQLIATTGTSCIDTAYDSVVVGPGPTVSFTWDSVCVGSTMQLIDVSSTLSDTIIGYKWIFPDSTISLAKDTNHIFTICGSNIVVHIDSTNQGCIGIDTQLVYVFCPPDAAFSFTGLCSNSPTNFTDATTTDTLSSIISWHWDFGDGNQSSFQNPTHIYTSPGVYLVTLTVASNHGCVSSITDSVFIQYTGPIALFNTTPATICLGTPVQFNNYSQGIIQLCTWNFGDGSSLSNLCDPTHLYPSPGIDTVVLSVITTNGCTSYDSVPIIIHPVPITHFTNTTPCVNFPIQFVDSGYVPNNLDSIAWSSWTFDTNHFTFGDTAYYTFTTTGIHYVILSDSTWGGCSSTDSVALNIQSAPTASFTFSPLNGFPPLGVTFSNSSTGGDSYLWYFGDGDSSIFFNPFHTYYSDTVCDTIKLFVTNTTTGCKSLYTDSICLNHNVLDIAVNSVIATPNGNVLNVSAVIQNKGSIIIYNYELEVNVDGNKIIIPMQKTLIPEGISIDTFSQAFAINPYNPPPYVCVTAKNPNGISPDNNPSNDEQCASLLPDFQVFNIYPNPTQNTIYVESILPIDGEIKITLYDVLGQPVGILYDGQALKGFNKFEFSTSVFAKGEYFLTVEFGNKRIVNKLTKI